MTSTTGKSDEKPTTEVEAPPRRRRRSNLGGFAGQRLMLDPRTVDKENFQYRWINSTPDRVQRMTVMDDYDIVPVTESIASISKTREERPAGAGPSGGGASMILVRKPMELALEDKAEMQANLDVFDYQMANNQFKPSVPEALRSAVLENTVSSVTTSS